MDCDARIRAALAATVPPLDDDVVEELGQHAAATYATARAEGHSHEEAARRVDALLDQWRRDAPTLCRRSRRPAVVDPPPPATTTLFSVTYGVLLKPLPWPEADRLVRVSGSRTGHQPRVRGTITNGTYIAWHMQPSTIEEIGGWTNVPTTATVGNSTDGVRIQTASITPSLFTVLKARPLRGRLFVEDDGRPGGSFASKDVIILSYGLWQEWFGGRDDAIGSVAHVGGKPLSVVGVMPKDFSFPDRETRAWTPRAVAMFGGNGPAEIAAMPAIDMMTADVKPALMVLLAAVILLLATATANVASLQLARATTRRREIAVRPAIGAGAGRIARHWSWRARCSASREARRAWHSPPPCTERCRGSCPPTSRASPMSQSTRV